MFSREGPTLLELAKQALSSTDEGYDLLAPKFDHTPFRTPDPILDAVAPYLAVEKVKRGIDLACGTGAGFRILKPVCEEVWGLDRSQGMLEEARRKLGEAAKGVTLVRGDVLEAPLRQTFELATCFGAFGHIEEKDEEAFVARVKALLVPGGRFVFVTAAPPRKTSPGFWVAKGFNAAMRVRNALIQPPFVMYYLTFLLPRATKLLEAQGFAVAAYDLHLPKPFERAKLKLVVTTRGP